jgi:protein SCO1/2
MKVRKIAIDDEVPAAARPKAVEVGQAIPDFTLTDESGRAVRLSDYRGRVVALDFIYTRCPLPDVCPRLSANFAALQKRVPDLALLSVTIDPEFDKPAVLAEYARRYGAVPERWRFLTGSLDDVRRVASYFGLLFWNEESMIAHTAATAVVDREGRLAGLVEGSSYRWEQLRDLAAVVMK